MLIVALLPCLPWLARAEDHWTKFTAGSFVVLTDAGPNAGRQALVDFEEFRHAVGEIVGEQDLQTPQPVHILVFKKALAGTAPPGLIEGRDSYGIVLDQKNSVPPVTYADLARLLLRANTAQMPPAFEHGLVEFFSTFHVKGIQITVGAPPAGRAQDLDWARIHLLVVDPRFYGTIRVLLYNLRKGVDEDAAYRNAFGKSPAEIEALAKEHLTAGNFQTTSLSSRPMADRNLSEQSVSAADARLARADLLLGPQSAADYRALIHDRVKIPEAREGLGLLALREHRTSEALQDFAAAIQAGSISARCYIEYAKLEPERAKATPALLKAASLNPKLDEPYVLLAEHDTDPQQRLAHWKAATDRNPRDPAHWKALAECYLAEHDYSGAANAWKQGEQAATDPAERARMRQARLAIEQQRLDYEAAEKRRQAEEDARELDQLKAQAREHLHALETKYNQGESKPSGEVVPWWTGPVPPAKITGTLKQVDCLGKQARLLVVRPNGKTVKLLVPDPTQVAISGGGALALGCGAQKARPVTIEYFPKTNARLATVGEVATIQFQ